MPIQPAIQPSTPREANTRPDQPPFAGTLEDASRSFSPPGEDDPRRETGAGGYADPAPPVGTEPSDRTTEVGRSTTVKVDSDDETARGEDVDPGPVGTEPDASGALKNSDAVAAGTAGAARSIDSRPVVVEVREAASASGEDGRMPPRGTAGPGRESDAGPMTADGLATAAGAGSNAESIDASTVLNQGMAAATAAASSSAPVRSASDQRSATVVDARGSTRSAIPTGDGVGAKAIPEGMRGLDPAAMATAAPRSRSDATASQAARQRGDSAVARAAEMNTALRNARGDGDASNGSRAGNLQGSMFATAAGSISAATGISNPASPEAQSLPTGPASVAPMEANAESGRTVVGVARGLQALSSQRGGTLVMRLDPGNLGQVRMEMSLDAGRVQVVISAAGDAARGLLRENLGVLRHALEDRGFAVERLTVESTARTTADSSGPRGDSRGDGQDARGGQGSSDRQDASDERSRGRRDDATDRRSERSRSESDRFQEVLAGSGETSNE